MPRQPAGFRQQAREIRKIESGRPLRHRQGHFCLCSRARLWGARRAVPFSPSSAPHRELKLMERVPECGCEFQSVFCIHWPEHHLALILLLDARPRAPFCWERESWRRFEKARSGVCERKHTQRRYVIANFSETREHALYDWKTAHREPLIHLKRLWRKSHRHEPTWICLTDTECSAGVCYTDFSRSDEV